MVLNKVQRALNRNMLNRLDPFANTQYCILNRQQRVSMKNKKPLMVTLLHGTFAKNAPWTHDDSLLSQNLSKRGYQPSRIDWSAGNSYRQRSDAAQALQTHITNNPEYEHVVIAHSHGGNVAIRAADGDDSIFKGIICLNTPFLNILGRHIGIFNNIGMISVIAASLIPLGIGLKSGFSWWLALAYFGIVIGSALGSLLFLPIKHFATQRIQGFRFKSLKKTPIYCLNTPDDEAYSGLAFFSSLQNVLFLAISSPVLINRAIGALIGMLLIFEVLPFVFVPWDLWTNDFYFTRELYTSLLDKTMADNPWAEVLVLGKCMALYFISCFYYYALYPLGVFLLLIIVSTAVTISQGTFSPLAGLFTRFLVTLVPLKSINTHFEEIAGDNTNLRHSALYNDQYTIDKIMQWIDALENTE